MKEPSLDKGGQSRKPGRRHGHTPRGRAVKMTYWGHTLQVTYVNGAIMGQYDNDAKDPRGPRQQGT